MLREGMARKRAQAQRIGRCLYRLPPELFIRVMDYLDFHDIMCIAEDPEFPIELLHKRHLVRYNDSILSEIISWIWFFPSAIRRMIPIIEDWDTGGTESRNCRPLLAALDRRNYQFCELFLEAGAKVDLYETTCVSENAIGHFMTSLSDKMVRRFTDVEHLTSRQQLRSTAIAPLHIAVMDGKVELVELLLRHGADPNAPAGVIGTSLHLTGDPEMATLLIANGADVNARNALGESPLFLAIDRYKEELFETLIEAGADINAMNDQHDPVLNLAIDLRYESFTTMLIDANCDINGRCNGVPPLYKAAEGNLDMVYTLLQRNVDINRTYNGQTVLHKTTHPEIARLLLSCGADLNAKDKNGSTPFMLAVQGRNLELMELYLMADAEVSLKHLRENDILDWIVYNGLYHLLKMLMSKYNLTLALDESRDLLRTAILSHYEGIAFLLIDAFPHLVVEGDVNKERILRAAAEWSSPRLLQRIIDLRKKVDPENAEFIEALKIVIDTKRGDNLKLLPQALIEPRNMSRNVGLALFILSAGSVAACENILQAFQEHTTKWKSAYEKWFRSKEFNNVEEDLSMLQTLIDQGADVSRVEFPYIGILHVAAWRNEERLMRALLTAGANPLCKDPEGLTPADWAAHMSHHKMEKMLRLAEALAKQQKEEDSK